MLGNGVYSFQEAARLAQLNAATLRAWFLPGRRAGTLTAPDYPSLAGRYAISFHDMIEGMMAASFRRAGVKYKRLRAIYSNLASRFNTDHPFCRRDLATDGHSVFLRAARESGDSKLVDLFDNQLAIPKVIGPILTSLEFDEATKLASLWRPADLVVVDPQRNLGKPSLEESGVATSVIADAVATHHGKIGPVAEWFEISEAEVLAAIQFERGLAA